MTSPIRKTFTTPKRLASRAGLAALLASGTWYLACVYHPAVGACEAASRAPRLSPDYTGLVIPPNIAPLNFAVKEEASWYCARISAAQGGAFEVFSRTPGIVLPARPWRRLLAANRGGEVSFDIFTRDKAGRWIQFQRVVNKIAGEDVDGFLAYRRIHPAHNLWKKMGIYQRSLSGFDEAPVMLNDEFTGGCCHCHAFMNNRTAKMSVSPRSQLYGTDTLLVENDRVRKLGIKLGFVAWHPSGRSAACTVNNPKLLLYAGANEIREIVELDSDILCWYTDSETMKPFPQLARKEWLETWPAWSPDGRYLYFCRAPLQQTDSKKEALKRGYDLVRIRYEAEEDRWGEVEPVLSAKEAGLSIGQPRLSPDGRWLSFVMFNNGCWPIYHPESDVYLMDLEAAKPNGRYAYRRMEVSSDQCDSWVTWSSNSRWIVVGSARGNILFNRPYLAYVHSDGTTSKPFVLPQRDPEFYEACLDSFTMPELLAEPVRVSRRALAKALRSPEKIPVNTVPGVAATTPVQPGAPQEQ
ncbi:MAG: hypothetical protein WCK89_01130 [bacterium]